MKYLVWCPEYGQSVEDALEIETHGGGSEEAAAKWVEIHEQETVHFPVSNGGEVCVMVRNYLDHDTTWIVSGSARPHYWARKCA